MRLLAKYNRINLLVSITVLLLSSICFYFMLRYVLLHQLNNDLKVEEQEIIDYVKKNKTLPYPSNYKDQQVEMQPSQGHSVKRNFSSIDVYNKYEKEYIPTRQLAFPLQVEGKSYTIFIRKSQGETEDLIKMIVLITLGVVVLLLIVLFVINRFLLNKMWQPFNSTLNQLKEFNLSSKPKLKLENSNISEFRELNQAVTIMTSQVSEDYDSLKSFTENASHEMQTPLAIINSKLDVLIQDETISEHQMQQLQGIYDALDRLSKLNQSLLLLTKIENHQFYETESISMDELVEEKLFQFDELIGSKKLNVKKNLQPSTIEYNKQLMDILVSNLLNNAIRYNYEKGTLGLTLLSDELRVSNTSSIPALNKQIVFQRFYRHTDTKQDGNGLGLSIVKQICDVGGFSIRYHFTGNLHEFSIHF